MALKPKQKEVIEYMVLNPDLTNEQYAEFIGINPKTLYAWKKQDEFNEYIHECCRKKFASLERLAINKLKQQVQADNWKAIEYVLNGVGYKPTDKIEVSDTTIRVNITE